MESPESRPNYVTLKKVVGPPVAVTSETDPSSLGGRIAMIDSADPGYDWIFARSISGLITKYGGAGSHMAIRAAEFDLPAAIGCGEALFSRLSNANVVEINCAEKYAIAL
jgi:phosphohistidine swiveling domain-containing protein